MLIFLKLDAFLRIYANLLSPSDGEKKLLSLEFDAYCSPCSSDIIVLKPFSRKLNQA